MRRTAFLLAMILSTPVLSRAQSVPTPPQRFEMSFLLGRVQPSIVVEEPGGLRTRPTLRETDESYGALTQEVTARMWWTRRMSTMVSGGWSVETSRRYTFSARQAPPIPPFTHYEAERTVFYRSRFVSLAQAWDLRLTGPVVPFVAGGLELRSVVNQQDTVSVAYFDPTSRLSSSSERSGTQIAALAGAGLRLLIGRHGVMSADGAVFATHSTAPRGSFVGRWRVGAGVRF